MKVRAYRRDGSCIGALTDPQALLEFGRLHADERYRNVAASEVAGAVVSTVWLGLDHGMGRTPAPLIFETMVFARASSGGELERRRYATEADAVAGHAEAVDELVHLVAQVDDIEVHAVQVVSLTS